MPEYLELTLKDAFISGYSTGSASAAPITGEAGLANFSIEQPVERSDVVPTPTFSLNFGEVKVPDERSADGGGGQGAGKVVVEDLHVAMQDAPGSSFAYDASFLGGVDVPTGAGQESGHAGQIDVTSFSSGGETSAAEASGPMKESMETMKKAWKDAASAGPGLFGDAAGADWAFGDGPAGSETLIHYTGLEGDAAGIARVTDADTGEHAAQNNLRQMSLATINTADVPDPVPLSRGDLGLWQDAYGTGSAAALDAQFPGGITVAAGDIGESRNTYVFEGNTGAAILGDGSIHLLSRGVSGPAWSGAGLDVLIANTGYDRDGIDASEPSGRQAMLKMVTADYCGTGTASAPDHSGGILVALGDGSVRTVDSSFAYEASFLGGVNVPTGAGQESGHAGQIDVTSFSWGGGDTSAAAAEAGDAIPKLHRTGATDAAASDDLPGNLQIATFYVSAAGAGVDGSETANASGSGHTAGANMLLADGHVTFDPAEFFTSDDGAASDHSGAFGFGDGSVRHVGPSATSGHSGAANLVSFDTGTPETAPVTERESGLTYSGESGGMNEAQTAAVQPQSVSWGLDRIDMLDDAAAPLFAYDAGLNGHNTGALRNVSNNNEMPAAAGDNMQTYLEIDALLSSYASGKASEDDFAAAPVDTGSPLGNTYTGMTIINDGVLQQDMTLSFSYYLV